MPLVRISLREGKAPEYRRAVADSVHDAMVATIGIPKDDRFQVITEHGEGGLIYDPGYLGIKRSDDVVFIQITLSTGRTVEIKKALYARIAENLSKSPGLRKEDVFVNLVEVVKENWSFGNGDAQYSG
ncbi:MAG TPA: tautomerase family protein [Thermoanaerobaculia bacterium]|nr:tautomerase family protein [Thermoanaerobaculia bacterium]